MKLFAPAKVGEMMETGQWTDDTWDAQLRRQRMNLIGDRTSVPDPRQRGHLPSYRADPDTLRVRAGRSTDIRLIDSATGDEIEELASFMDDAQVAKYKWPEHVRHLDEMPRNPVGRVPHRELRERLEAAK